jgi:hypothetical protein
MALNILSSQKSVSAASILFLTLFSLKRNIGQETRKLYHKMNCLKFNEILQRYVRKQTCIVLIRFFVYLRSLSVDQFM